MAQKNQCFFCKKDTFINHRMTAEEVYNIAIYLSDTELERLFSLIRNKVKHNPSKVRRPVKIKIISDEEAREYVLKTVFKVKPKNNL